MAFSFLLVTNANVGVQADGCGGYTYEYDCTQDEPELRLRRDREFSNFLTESHL